MRLPGVAALAGAILALMGAANLSSESADANRVVILHTTSSTYEAAGIAAEARLRALGIPFERIALASDAGQRRRQMDAIRRNPPKVILTGGSAVTHVTLEAVSNVPVVSFITPNMRDALNDDLLRHRPRLACISTDVPAEQQLRAIRSVQPGARSIAIVHSASSVRRASEFRDAARKLGLQIVLVSAARDAFPKAIDALTAAGPDAVLMLPDANVFNAPNVRRLLLWGVRENCAVWAFSANIVSAGAAACTAGELDTVGATAADLANRILRGARPEEIGLQYCEDAKTVVNAAIAERIGLDVDRIRRLPEMEVVGDKP